MGRARREIDFEQLDSILCTGLGSLEYCAERQLIADGDPVNITTIKSMGTNIERKIREKFDCTFMQYKKNKQEHIQVMLSAKQIEQAMKGNSTMLVWLGKNKLGQADKIEERVEVTKLEWNIGFADEDDQADPNATNGTAKAAD